jgi:hypothetical protein
MRFILHFMWPKRKKHKVMFTKPKRKNIKLYLDRLLNKLTLYYSSHNYLYLRLLVYLYQAILYLFYLGTILLHH